MARRARRPAATREQALECVQRVCPECGGPMWVDYENYRSVSTLDEVVRLTLKVRRCQAPTCGQYHRPYRPEAEGGWSLPGHEYGLDVIAQIGVWRYQEHRTVPEMHERLRERGVQISQRSVTNLLQRYDELVSLSLQNSARLRQIMAEQGRVILAIDGLQPDVRYDQKLWIDREKEAAHPWGEHKPNSGGRSRGKDTPCSSLLPTTRRPKLRRSCYRWTNWPGRAHAA